MSVGEHVRKNFLLDPVVLETEIVVFFLLTKNKAAFSAHLQCIMNYHCQRYSLHCWHVVDSYFTTKILTKIDIFSKICIRVQIFTALDETILRSIRAVKIECSDDSLFGVFQL